MASTKERQALAKLNRKIKLMNETTATVQAKVSESVSKLETDTHIRLAGPMQLAVMFNQFVEDYRKNGDPFRTATNTGESYFTEQGANRTSYAISYQGQDAGFIVIRNENSRNSMIEVVYVKPEFRNLGLGALMYRWAILEKGATLIELSFGRVVDKIAYWRSLGFTKLMSIPNQKGTRIGLCMLSTNRGGDLNPVSLKYVRNACNTKYANWIEVTA
jgi:GNAT superfamily N-acetyltransferase